jgi:hypothetical protein
MRFISIFAVDNHKTILIMKKVILSLLVCLTYFCAFSQINKTIWGVTIGKSTKNQVLTILKNQGFKNIGELEDDGFYITDYSGEGKIRFGGIPWESMHFCFFNGKLYRIDFYRTFNYRDGYSNSFVKNTVISALSKKYSDYYFDSTEENNRKEVWYYDNVIAINFSEDNNYHDFSLVYYDFDAFKQKQAKENDEF